MMLRLLAVLFLLPLQDVPELTDDSFDKWRDSIRPDKEELKWTRVPWRPTFWGAVCEAQKEKKPVLLWAMNGHPLACT